MSGFILSSCHPLIGSLFFEFQYNLRGFFRLLAEQCVGLSCFGEGEAMGDKPRGPDLGEKVERGLQAARFCPPPGEVRIESADLTADQFDSAPMETATEIESGAVGSVPRADHDSPVEASESDGLIERGGRAGEFVNEIKIVERGG